MSRKVTLNALDYFSASERCFLKDGRLTPAYAAVSAGGTLPEGTEFVTYSSAVRRYFACSGDATYVSGDGNNFVKLCNYGSAPFLVEDYFENTGRAIVITGDRATLHWGPHTGAILPYNLSSGAMHCGRLFAADGDNGFLLRWSGVEGVEDWKEGLTGSGYLYLDNKGGKILDILPFGAKLVLVRQNAVTLLDMQSDPEKFSVRFTDTACAGAVKNTACVVSGKLYFFASSGLKVFDGGKISSVEFRHLKFVASPRRCIVYDNKYFIACTSKKSGKGIVVCLDLESGESCVVRCQADSLFVKDGQVMFSDFSSFYKLTEAEDFSFETDEITFGTGRRKTVVGAFTDGVCDIVISNGKTSRKFIAASGLVRPKLRGEKFKIKVYAKSGISKINLTAEVLDGI